MRRQQGSGGSSSGQVDGSGEAVMGEEAAEVDERYFGTGSGGGDRARRWWRLEGRERPTIKVDTVEENSKSLFLWNLYYFILITVYSFIVYFI